jgi:O-antigen/teichoic acid export membrane protein
LNPLKQLAGQTAIYGLSSVIARILNFLLVPFYTRIFTDTAEYGIINELYAYVAFFIIILTYGMETAFFRFTSKYKDSQLVYSTSLFSLITTSTAFVIFIAIFYARLASAIGYEEHSEFILLLGLVLALDAIAAIPFARLRFRNQALRFALIKLFNICVNITFNLFFLLLLPWLFKKGIAQSLTDILYFPEFRVGYVFLSNLLASLFTLMFFVNDILRSRLIYSGKVLREMIFYSLPLLVAGLAGTVNEVIDRILLRHRLPEGVNALEEIGIYGANIKIAVLMTLFIQMFRYASEPFFFSHHKNDDSRILYARILHYFTIAGIFVFLGITLYIDIFKHIIGPEYREGLKVVPIVLVGNLLLGIYFNLSIWYKLRELTFFGAIFAATGALITVAVNYVFIPHYGYMASAWAHFFSYAAMVLLAYFFGKIYYPVPYKIRILFFYFLSGIGLYLLSSVLKIESNFLRFAINTSFIFIFTGIVAINELAGLKDIFGKGKRKT